MEKEKAWFIEVNKLFEEKNLKIFYLPLSNLQKILTSQQYQKIPDPTEYFVGVTYLSETKNSKMNIDIKEGGVIKENITSAIITSKK